MRIKDASVVIARCKGDDIIKPDGADGFIVARAEDRWQGSYCTFKDGDMLAPVKMNVPFKVKNLEAKLRVQADRYICLDEKGVNYAKED